MAFLSFPLRLKAGGLLERIEEPAAVLQLLEMMATTPAGSWSACPTFGLRDLMETGRQRADAPRLAAERANQALADLGITNYRVDEIVREVSDRTGVESYLVTLIATRTTELFSTRLTAEAA